MVTAERWLKIMIELSRVRHATMPELAQKFDVSVRTIQRDIIGITPLMPIQIKYGRYDGGIYVIGDYTIDRVYMEPNETNLLIKIKDIVNSEISDEENELLNYIIKTYTKPAHK